MTESARIRLSDHFTYGKLLRFTLPSIAMMVFSSIYGVVDGYFVSNYAGKTPFAAVNLVMPVLAIMGTVSFSSERAVPLWSQRPSVREIKTGRIDTFRSLFTLPLR